jgi:hypothetical protein
LKSQRSNLTACAIACNHRNIDLFGVKFVEDLEDGFGEGLVIHLINDLDQATEVPRQQQKLAEKTPPRDRACLDLHQFQLKQLPRDKPGHGIEELRLMSLTS